VIADPPVLAGALNATLTCPALAVGVTPVGTPGLVATIIVRVLVPVPLASVAPRVTVVVPVVVGVPVITPVLEFIDKPVGNVTAVYVPNPVTPDPDAKTAVYAGEEVLYTTSFSNVTLVALVSVGTGTPARIELPCATKRLAVLAVTAIPASEDVLVSTLATSRIVLTIPALEILRIPVYPVGPAPPLTYKLSPLSIAKLVGDVKVAVATAPSLRPVPPYQK